jgi:hypothetical protein
LVVVGQIIAFAERVAHEVWIEVAGNRDGLEGGWETQKVWKLLRMADNSTRMQYNSDFSMNGSRKTKSTRVVFLTVLVSILVFLECCTPD